MNPRIIITIILACAFLHADDAKEALLRHYKELASKHKESRAAEGEFNILKNGDFSQEKKDWKFHLCALEKIDGISMTVLRSKSKDYRKVWQMIPVSLRPGSTVRLKARIKASSLGGTPPYLFVDFFNAEKKNVYDDKERGKKLAVIESGDLKEFEVTYRVPEGAVTAAPSLSLADVGEVYLRSMSLTATLTGEEASALGITKSDAPTAQPSSDTERIRTLASPNAVVLIPHPRTITVDGDASDWGDIASEGAIDRPSGANALPDDTRDTSGKFKLAMDDDNFYILASIADDTLVFGKEKNWNDDSVEIFISPDFNQDVKNGEREVQLVFCPQNDAISDIIITGRKFAEVGALAKGARTAKGFRLEIAIPLKNSLFTLSPFGGRPFGFNISYSDNDRGKGRDHKLTWSMYDGKDESFKKPSVLGAAVIASDTPMPFILDTRPARAEMIEEVRDIVNTKPGMLNALVNGDFERDDEGWHKWYGVEGHGLTYSVDTSVKAHGEKSFCIDGTARKDMTGSGSTGSAGRFLFCAHTVNVIPGEKYRAAFSIRTTAQNTIGLTVRTKTPSYFLRTVGSVRLSEKDGWVRKEIDLTIPGDHIKKDNVLQLYFDCQDIAGEKIWFDDVVLTRYVPGNVDALLRLGKHDHSFAVDDKKAAMLIVTNSGDSSDVTVRYAVRDNYYRTNVSAGSFSFMMPSGAGTNAVFPMAVSYCGNFKLLITIEDGRAKKKFYRETDISIYKKPDRGADISQLVINHAVYLPKTALQISGSLAAMKVRSVRMFAASTYEVAPGKYDFSEYDTVVPAFAAKGIEVIPCIRVVKEGSNKPLSDLDKFYRDVHALVSHFKGRIRVWEMGNEVDLWMGWPPNADHREYAMLLRVGYNAVKNADPAALVATAGFNNVSYAGYLNDFIHLTKGNFYDIFAFHFYDFLTSANYKDDMQALMNGLWTYQERPIVYETESGSDHHTTVEEAMELMAKKRPFLLYYGVERHHEFGFDKMNSGYLYASYGSSAPNYAAFCYQTARYAGAQCVGRTAFGKDHVAYLFTKDGKHFAVLWQGSYAPKVSASIMASGPVYDIFGNDISSRFQSSGGTITIPFTDRLPVYVDGIDMNALGSAIERFTPEKTKSVSFEKKVILTAKDFTGYFDVTLVRGFAKEIPVTVWNCDSKARTITLSAAAEGFAAETSKEPITLAPGEQREATVRVASADAKTGTLTITGAAGDALAPLILSLSVQGDITMQTESRFLRVRNNGTKIVAGTVSFASKIQDVAPLTFDIASLAPNDEAVVPYTIMSKSAGVKESHGKADITARFIDTGKTIDESVRFQPDFFTAKGTDVPDIRDALALNQAMAKLPVMNIDGRSIALAVQGKELIVLARIDDEVHVQDSDRGQIANGDSIIIGIDQNNDSREKGYQPDDFECGFALRSDGRIVAYRWDGKYGLEGAKPFDAAKASIFREKNVTCYALRIPISLPANAACFGFSLMVNNIGGAGTALRFGGGLEGIRDPSRFGAISIIK